MAAATVNIASELPFWLSFHLSPEAVLHAALLSVLAAAVVGVIPALKATSRPPQAGLRIIGAGGSGMRLGGVWTALIVTQVAFAVALLPAAIFSGWTSLRSGFAGPGFEAQSFLSAQLSMDYTPAGGRVQADLLRRLETEPPVSAVTFAAATPGDEPPASIQAQDTGSSGHQVRVNRVDVNFFRAFGVPILAGRGFERPNEQEAVLVNRTLAQRIFGGSALGRRIRYVESAPAGQDAQPGRWHQIVGIVSDFPPEANLEMGDSTLKLYHAAEAAALQPLTIALRVRDGDPSAFAPRLREIAAAVDHDLELRNIVSLDEALRRDQWIRRMEAVGLAAVTISVLLLSAAGIYSLMSFTVTQRRKEIGIRAALGAGGKRIVAGIFSRALTQLALGAALGMVSAAMLERASGLMQGNAQVVLPIVALMMMAAGFLAVLGPARRALRIQPTEALREQ